MEFLIGLIARFIASFSDYAINAWNSIKYLNITPFQAISDIFIVSVLFYWLIQWVRGTRAKQILTGLMVIAALYMVSVLLGLRALEWLLNHFFTLVLVAIPIIFQDEIRRGLQKLGEARFFASQSEISRDSIKEIVQAAEEMARLKYGALIVIRGEVNLEEYESTGMEVNANVYAPLLLAIFNPKSPLHDGAVMIKNDTLSHTACILPQSTKKYNGSFGTRHKAALTLSELTDAIVIVVSEERRTISVAYDGKLQENLSPELLEKRIISFMNGS